MDDLSAGSSEGAGVDTGQQDTGQVLDQGGQGNQVADSQPAQNPWNFDGQPIRVKADGREHEFRSLDELKQAASLGLGGRRALQEAAELRKAKEQWEQERTEIGQQLMQFLEGAKKDPSTILRELGYDPIEWANSQLEKHLKHQAMSPEERREYEQAQLRDVELDRTRAELEQLRREREESIRQQQEAQAAAERQQAMQEFNATIEQAIADDPYLAGELVKPGVIERAAQIMIAGHGQGVYMTPEQAVAYVRAERREQVMNTLKGMAPEQIISALGEDWVKKIRDFDVARVQEKVRKVETQKRNETGKRFLTLKEYREAMGS